MVADVEDHHRGAMSTIPAELRELHDGDSRHAMASSRRRFLRGAGIAGLGGTALTIGGTVLGWSRLVGPSGARAGGGGGGEGGGDAAIAAFAESVELAAAQVYAVASASGLLTTAAVAAAATTFAGHHDEHARAFASVAGDAATGEPNPGLLELLTTKLEGTRTETAVLRVVYDLENAAAATYLGALGTLESEQTLALAASILPVEAQHAAVLGVALELPAAEYIPTFEMSDEAVSTDDFPVAE